MRELIVVALFTVFLMFQPGQITETACSTNINLGITECEAYEYAPIPDLDIVFAVDIWHSHPGK